MLSHCSSQGCKAKQQNLWATLSIQPVYCKDTHSWKELHTIANSLGHCSNTEIPGEAFCKRHLFHLFMHSLKQQRKTSGSKFTLLWRTLDLPVQQLFSSRHCPVPPLLSSRVAATYLLEKSLLGRVSCGLRIGIASIRTFPCCGCPHREKLTLARALCALANPTGRGIPRLLAVQTTAAWGHAPVFRRKAGAETPHPEQSPAFTAPIGAWASSKWGWCQASCTKGNPACSEQRLLYHCQTAQDLRSVLFTMLVAIHISGICSRDSALFIQESQVGLILLC